MTWTGKNEVLDEVIGRAELERMLDEAGAAIRLGGFRRAPWCSGAASRMATITMLESGSVGCTASMMPPGARESSTATVPACSSVPYPARHQSDDVDGAVLGGTAAFWPFPRNRSSGLLRGGSDFPEYCVRYLFGLWSHETNEMLNQSFYVTAQRVPMLLAKLAAERLAEDAAQQMVVLPYSNNDIADMLGVSNSVTSVVSRLAGGSSRSSAVPFASSMRSASPRLP